MVAEQVARVLLPTPFGHFEARAFQCRPGVVYLALVRGEVRDGTSVLTRVHSECLTGDALGSLRCDCGVQLRASLKAIGASDRGVLIYATGQEGRGIGLVNKLRAYVEQDGGADTVDANLHLGLPADARRYEDASAVLEALGVRSVRLLTNNPLKVSGLRKAGTEVTDVVPLATAGHARNYRYLSTKRNRLGHLNPSGPSLDELAARSIDVTAILGNVRPLRSRPYVILKYAQSVDGRIATSTGDSKWISGEAERTLSHALRAACDAVMVGVGTVLSDNPQLTVRFVDGASPRRVVLDSKLRIPLDAAVLSEHADTSIITTSRAPASKRAALAALHVSVHEVGGSPEGVDLAQALLSLRRAGVHSLLVEGGSRVITSLIGAGLVDRLVVAVAPILLGSGREGVGDLGIKRVREGRHLTNRLVHLMDDDVVITWDISTNGRQDGREAGLGTRREAEALGPRAPRASGLTPRIGGSASGTSPKN
jgi:GTP cyclohydrolase II